MEHKQTARQKTVEQAEQFLQRNMDRLGHDSREIVEAFIKFDEAIFFGKAILMFKYGFYRVGLLRNLRLLFGSRNLRKLLQFNQKSP